jgi:hypothetical protein
MRWVVLNLNPAIWEAIAVQGDSPTVVVVVGWEMLSLNPHPLKDKGAAPNCRPEGSTEIRQAIQVWGRS